MDFTSSCRPIVGLWANAFLSESYFAISRVIWWNIIFLKNSFKSSIHLNFYLPEFPKSDFVIPPVTTQPRALVCLVLFFSSMCKKFMVYCEVVRPGTHKASKFIKTWKGMISDLNCYSLALWIYPAVENYSFFDWNTAYILKIARLKANFLHY